MKGSAVGNSELIKADLITIYTVTLQKSEAQTEYLSLFRFLRIPQTNRLRDFVSPAWSLYFSASAE